MTLYDGAVKRRWWQRFVGIVVLVAMAGGIWRFFGVPSAVSCKRLPVNAPPGRDTTVKSWNEAAPASNSPAVGTQQGTLVDKETRDRMRQLIWHAFGQAAPGDTAQPSPAHQPYVLPSAVPVSPGVPGRLEREYIRDRMHADFFPMAGGCYTEAQKRSPRLAGSIVLHFTIVGDSHVGGIVESADVMDRSTIRDPMMIECIRQSMLSMTFPPPQQGGFVTVDYPIDFDPDEEG
jgi:hypothetical protein